MVDSLFEGFIYNLCMIGVLGHDILHLYWVGDNLGELDEFCYES